MPNGRKVASRLELMQSPTSPDRVFRRHVSEFKMIAEPQSDDSGGCGFIPLPLQRFQAAPRGAFALRFRKVSKGFKMLVSRGFMRFREVSGGSKRCV